MAFSHIAVDNVGGDRRGGDAVGSHKGNVVAGYGVFDMIIALSCGMVASGVRQHSSRRGTVVVR